MSPVNLPPGIVVTAPITAEYAGILTSDAMAFYATLERAFAGRRTGRPYA